MIIKQQMMAPPQEETMVKSPQQLLEVENSPLLRRRNTTEGPAFSFGLIADVQYADKDDVEKYTAGKWRYYRHSLTHVKQAVDMWNGVRNKDDIASFVIQLGDLIDGHNAQVYQSQEALDITLRTFGAYTRPVHHVWGNHEMYNFSRKELFKSPLANVPENCERDDSKTGHYYCFSPAHGYRIVVLDTYEVSLLGYDKTDELYELADRRISENNPNSDRNCNDGMKPELQQFVCYNGGLHDNQLKWLENVLDTADEKQEQIIVAGQLR